MIFNSYEFMLLFMPVFLLAYWIIKKTSVKKPSFGNGCKLLIVLASVVFYAPFGVRNCVVLAASILVNAFVAYRLFKNRSMEKDGKTMAFDKRKGLLVFSLLANLVSLLFFKFSGIFFPVAVSFYTFNQISYIVDMYRGEIESFDLTNYLAYILFFPKILQGPLMGYGEFVKELDKALGANSGDAGNAKSDGCNCRCREYDYKTILRALLLLSMGLFKKVILADTFGKAVDFGYESLASLGSLEAILVAVFYSFQLYFDFSGYCDMAAAVCMMMGFDLPLNFNSPYQAVDIVDFWKRWHITLTKFFTKYVYIPLGGNRKGAARMYANFMIVFLLSGLWHGSGWTFIVWGAMHGVAYVVTRAGEGSRKSSSLSTGKESADLGKTVEKQRSVLDAFGQAISVALTFIYVTVAWVFFRADTVSDAIALLTRVIVGGPKKIATGLSACFQLDELWYVIKVTPIMKLPFAWDTCLWLFLVAGCVIVFFQKNALEIAKNCKIGVMTTLLTALLLVWSILSFAGVSTFLYMNF
jgi:D-alanyl-lipoteichoic acid acyltransferase DltB (MBOAT superfamily)